MSNGKNYFHKGFIIYLVLSLLVNLMFVTLFKKQAEYLASDLLHLMPTGVFNALLEGVSPMFPDILFLIPLGLTDGVIGGFVGLLLGRYFRNKSKGIIYTYIFISFAIFEAVDIQFIPIFAP